MKYKELGKSEIWVSALGLGLMPLAGTYGASVEESQGYNLLEEALELGVNFWDTADIYGVDYSGEKFLAPILKDRREEVILATKFGFCLKPGYHDGFLPNSTYLNTRPEYIHQAVDASLLRLGTDYIDLYYAHRLDPQVPVEETVGAMGELVKAGKVKAIGLSECTAEDLLRGNKEYPITAVESEFSLISSSAREEIIPLCLKLGVSFIPFAPLGRGLVSSQLESKTPAEGDFRSRLPRFQGESLERNRKLSRELRLYAERLGYTAAQLSLAWVMAQGEHLIPIPGTSRIEHLKKNAQSAEIVLSEENLNRINTILRENPPAGERYGENENKFLKRKV